MADSLEAAHEAGLCLVRVIHGRGTGTQGAVVHHLLGAHPLVVEHRDAPESRLGATLVRLRARKPDGSRTR